eukprot:2376224-Rhodomonas_salina.4
MAVVPLLPGGECIRCANVLPQFGTYQPSSTSQCPVGCGPGRQLTALLEPGGLQRAQLDVTQAGVARACARDSAAWY